MEDGQAGGLRPADSMNSPYFQVFFVSFWEQLADRPRSVPPHSLFLTDDFAAVAVATKVMRSMCLCWCWEVMCQ